MRDPAATVDAGLFSNIDWTRTRAYALGLNGLYINVRGREAHGIVDAAERVMLAGEIARSLSDTTDPKDGGHPIRRVFRREDVFHVAGHEDIAPDLIVGYAKGTRSSDDSALGMVPRYVLTDNTEAWSGDHCMDPEVVPGILLTSRPLRQEAPSLERLASALLAEFGINNFPEIRRERDIRLAGSSSIRRSSLGRSDPRISPAIHPSRSSSPTRSKRSSPSSRKRGQNKSSRTS